MFIIRSSGQNFTVNFEMSCSSQANDVENKQYPGEEILQLTAKIKFFKQFEDGTCLSEIQKYMKTPLLRAKGECQG